MGGDLRSLMGFLEELRERLFALTEGNSFAKWGNDLNWPIQFVSDWGPVF